MNEQERISTAFDILDNTHGKTQGIRDNLIDKFTEIVTAADFSLDNASPEDRESFMSVVNGLGGLLNDQERSALNTVKISLQQRKDDDDHDNSANVTALLHMINPAFVEQVKNNIDGARVDGEIEDAFNSSNVSISEGELETVGE